MDDTINKLTHDMEYGTDIVLMLMASDNNTSLYYLDYLNITGKELENLPNCLIEYSLDYLVQTIRFLRSGFISLKDIHANLNSDKPVCFIPRLLNEGEDWEMAYEDFTGDFYSNFKKNKSR